MTRDIFHEIVKGALENDGWTITHDPLSLKVGGVEVSIDLGAEQLIAAERKGEKIAVEIKSFIRPSAIFEFHTALGQYMNYRRALRLKEPERLLFLAIPLDTYQSFFKLPFIRESIEDYQLNLIVYDIDRKVISEWKKQTSTEPVSKK